MKPALTIIGIEPDPARRLRQWHGENIADARKLRGLTRAELAEGVGVTEAAVGMWERGETSPRPHHQLAIARLLQTKHRTLFPMEVAA